MIRNLLRSILVFLVVFFVAGRSAEATKITIDLAYCGINYSVPSNKVWIIPGFMSPGVIEPKPAWEATPISKNVYHVRIPGKRDTLLKLDAETKQIFIVSNGAFGKAGGSEQLLTNAVFPKPLPFAEPIPGLIEVQLRNAVLSYDSDMNDISITAEGIRFLGSEDIEIVKPADNIYHMRIRGMQNPKAATDSFWKIDTSRERLSQATGRFGEREDSEIQFQAKITVEDGKPAAKESVIHKDLGMEGLRKETIRESAWIGAEQEMYREALSRQKFDLLIVPFQVQDNAFDHIERALMSRYLARRIAATTDFKIPDPELIERALGWGSRTFSEQRIYKLANALGVRTLIRVYAGHGRDMKMRITTVVQERPQNGMFDTAVKGKEVVFKDIAFTDEKLPSDVFADMLPSVLYGLGIKEIRNDMQADGNGLSKVALPATLMEIEQSSEISPLIQAAYLGILSALSPDGSRTSECFLERSLALLRGISPSSQDAIFLKAYAFSNLYRRPAALEVLRKPSTQEQLALRSYLDSDLPALTAQVEKIKNPIPKLLMQIALNDLRWSYAGQSARPLASKALEKVPPGWSLFSSRRFLFADLWEIPSTIELKRFLDENYPVKGYTLQDIARGMEMQGDFNQGDTLKIDSSVSDHRKQLLMSQPELLDGDLRRQVRPMDILDLVEDWAEETVIKSINLEANVRAAWEEGLSLIDKYEFYFKGHPRLATLKSTTLRTIARYKSGTEAKNLVEKANELDSDACFWFQGQTRSSNKACRSIMFYENDFPRREFWRSHQDSSMYGDRDDYELRETTVTIPVPTNQFFAKMFKSQLRDIDLALRYTITDFSRFQNYYYILRSNKFMTAADTLAERTKNRFNGMPSRTAFLASQYEKKGNDREITKLYGETFLVIPGVWQPYYELGLHYLKRGETRQANEIFKRFPSFREASQTTAGDSIDNVSLSNYAHEAGSALHWSGLVEDAMPFFKLSAGYQTGSGQGMQSEYELALNAGNYQRAAEVALSIGRRYESAYAYANYLRLLSITMNTREWESLFIGMNMKYGNFTYWTPVLTSLRMEGESDEKVRAWLTENGKGKVGRSQTRSYYLNAFLVDRPPDPGLADIVEHIEKQVQLSDKDGPPMRYMDQQGRFIPSIPSLFAGTRYSLMMKQYEKAFGMLEIWSGIPVAQKGEGAALLPYFAWSGVKTGKREAVDKLLRSYQDEIGRNFEYWLSMAIIQSASRNHDEALKSLNLARTNVHSSNMNLRPVEEWYQLIEVCELLFEDTKVDAYRDRSLELARMYQRINPLDSWAYAVEAKYAKTEKDRLKPLAITLYLDRRSYHIEGITKQEKDQALQWLEKNNPFRALQPSQKRETSI